MDNSKYHIDLSSNSYGLSLEDSFYNYSNTYVYSLWSFKKLINIILSAFEGIFTLKPKFVRVPISRRRQKSLFLSETKQQ